MYVYIYIYIYIHTYIYCGPQDLVQEQDNVKRVQLAEAYMAGAELAGVGGSSLPESYDGQAQP